MSAQSLYDDTQIHTWSHAPTLDVTVAQVSMKCIRPGELSAAVVAVAGAQTEVDVANMFGNVGLRDTVPAESCGAAGSGVDVPLAICTRVPRRR